MTVDADVRSQVRQRAHFACEFCGISETDTGSQLTIDHFRPKSKEGTDDLDNLIYSCVRCNQYKLDYWPESPDGPMLWNPRQEPADQHFLELDDGTLYPLTTIGALTLQRLRLNRPPLIAHRLRRRREREHVRLLTRYRDLTSLLERLMDQQADLMQEYQSLLREQRELLQLLIDNRFSRHE
jgi:hypothetical protein